MTFRANPRSAAAAFAACLLLAACGGDGTVDTPAITTPEPVTTLAAGAPTLVLNVAGTVRGTDYDTLQVAAKATLGGNLQLHFVNGFRPSSRQSFIVVSAVGGVTGRFDAVNAEGIGYAIAYAADMVTVTIR